MGRPSEFTQEVADRICAELACGVSLRTVCKADDLPDARTAFRWLRTNPDFCQQYTRAKEESADALADEMLDIADDSAKDFSAGEEGPAFNSEHVQRSKLRVETRKWIASKLKPKKYGEKLAVGGAHDLPPVAVVGRIELVPLVK